MKSARKKQLSILIKIIILFLAGWFVYHRITSNNNLRKFRELIAETDLQSLYITLYVVFALMLVNWLLESGKWYYLASKIEAISFWQSVEAVFCGLTWAVFTPNRIGEYGGRVFFLSPRRRIHGVFAMAVGAFAQNVLTNVLGSFAAAWFLNRYILNSFWAGAGFYALAGLLSVAMILFYFKIGWLEKMLMRIRFLQKFERFFSILGRYSFPELLSIFLFSVARFAVFTSQYVLLFHLLLPEIANIQVVLMVFILFFIQSALPSLDLIDVGVRSLTAEQLFSHITSETVAVMAIVACVWFTNLIIPAILGAGFVFKLNFFGSSD
ncbi:MAG: flippase-like domain-containing protein [Mucilaginibacter polytrichastri]|nr:flippase-like domain-containing protein [Mucilaginibacter polytrichastri]